MKSAERQGQRELARSILASDGLVIGDIAGEGALEIAGRVQGNIKITGSVRVAPGGSVVGDIQADSVEIGGNVRGNLTAHTAIEIMGTAEVEGSLVAPRVGIETGAQVVGAIATGSKSSERRTNVERTPKVVNRPEPARTPRREEPVRSETPVRSDTSRLDGPLRVTEELEDEPEFDLNDEDDSQPGTPEPDADSEKAGRRRRKRRRNRRPDAAPPEVRDLEARAPDPGPSSSLPAGPPRVPTFQKGAHGRRRD